MLRQTNAWLTKTAWWWPRWGCFNQSAASFVEDKTGHRFTEAELAGAIERAVLTPVPFRKDGKHVFDVGPDGRSWWNYDPDWWLNHLVKLATFEANSTAFQIGHVDMETGETVWYCEKPWWPKDRGHIKVWHGILDYYTRPGGGGHYIYMSPFTGTLWNPDPSLTPLGLAAGERLLYFQEAP